MKPTDLKGIALLLLGAVLALLGMLWFMQGAAIIQICPILCFADCGCISGGSAQWEAIGIIAFIAGAALLSWNLGSRKKA